jgi:Flp pilus assembly protein TadB
MGAHPGGFLLGAGAGRAVCCAGVLLDVAGVLWMRAILRRAERP